MTPQLAQLAQLSKLSEASKAHQTCQPLDRKVLAAHVLVALARAQRAGGRALTLRDVAAELEVRKGDVRAVVASLHEEGYVDALRMQLTLPGLALASALRRAGLRSLRAISAAASSVVAA
ncbi:MAG TPA: helix-turn-helix domain-containing protein [Polyangiaceae bacterium]|jgi:DNA-binding MarR family transcriptional regulator|nr:helix-turn-helix domain-containing protein [Polyangiaceae bacterium]